MEFQNRNFSSVEILNLMQIISMTSLFIYIDSKIIRKVFQSIKESISASLSQTDSRRLYSSLRAKSVRVFMNIDKYLQI